jgi:hypothetical protein
MEKLICTTCGQEFDDELILEMHLNENSCKEPIKNLGKEPAFPIDGVYALDAMINNKTGISKRFYAACAAMQGVLSNPKTMGIFAKIHSPDKAETLISGCYAWADELLKQENE